jgi:hypothetical protein
MSTPPQSPTPDPGSSTPAPSVMQRALAYVAPAIAMLQSAALAAPQPNLPVHTTYPSRCGSPGFGATGTDSVCFAVPALDTPTLIVAGTALATIGAYRLMRARKRSMPDVTG